jgi:hypothetical protein
MKKIFERASKRKHRLFWIMLFIILIFCCIAFFHSKAIEAFQACGLAIWIVIPIRSIALL